MAVHLDDSIDYDVFLVTRGSLNHGKCRIHKNGITFKSFKTSRVENLNSLDIESLEWFKAPKSYGLKVLTKNGTMYKFNGFENQEFDSITKFTQNNYNVPLKELQFTYKGWNKGFPVIKGSLLQYLVDGVPSFEIPLKDVCQTSTGKNEVSLQFHQNDDCPVSLMEMKFYVPSTNGTSADPVKEMNETIQKFGDITQVVGDAIATFPEITCLTPRGRYSFKIYPTLLQLHGKTFDYKIPYSAMIRFFLLPHKERNLMFFVISLDPPIKQGQTRYPYLVIQLERDLDITLNLKMTEKEIKEKIGNDVGSSLSGPLFEVFSTIIKCLIGKKITVPGNFKSHLGSACISCSHRASNGLLYPLERGFIFVHKPANYVRYEEVTSLSFARGSLSARSFDFELYLNTGQTVTFCSIEKEEYNGLFDFFTSKNLKIKSKADVKTSSVIEELIDSDIDDHDAYLHKMKNRSSESENDDDFNPSNYDDEIAEEFDSNAETSSTDNSPESQKKSKKPKIK